MTYIKMKNCIIQKQLNNLNFHIRFNEQHVFLVLCFTLSITCYNDTVIEENGGILTVQSSS